MFLTSFKLLVLAYLLDLELRREKSVVLISTNHFAVRDKIEKQHNQSTTDELYIF